jgi:hypothetical protein
LLWVVELVADCAFYLAAAWLLSLGEIEKIGTCSSASHIPEVAYADLNVDRRDPQ